MIPKAILFLVSILPLFLQAELIDIASSSHLEQELQSVDKPTFLYFYSDGCCPCRNLKPEVQAWGTRVQEGAKVLRIDIDKLSELTHVYKVQGVPCMAMVDEEGKVVISKAGRHQITHLMSTYDKLLQGKEVVSLERFVQEVGKG